MLKKIINAEGVMAFVAAILMVPFGAMVIAAPDLFLTIGFSHPAAPFLMGCMVFLGFVCLARSVYLQRHHATRR